MYSAEPLPHFVDEYLSYLYEVHPTTATFDGVHLHTIARDVTAGIDCQSGTLWGSRALGALTPAVCARDGGRPALDPSIRALLFELEDLRTWERSRSTTPRILADQPAGQALFEYAPSRSGPPRAPNCARSKVIQSPATHQGSAGISSRCRLEDGAARCVHR